MDILTKAISSQLKKPTDPARVILTDGNYNVDVLYTSDSGALTINAEPTSTMKFAALKVSEGAFAADATPSDEFKSSLPVAKNEMVIKMASAGTAEIVQTEVDGRSALVISVRGMIENVMPWAFAFILYGTPLTKEDLLVTAVTKIGAQQQRTNESLGQIKNDLKKIEPSPIQG